MNVVFSEIIIDRYLDFITYDILLSTTSPFYVTTTTPNSGIYPQ